MSDPPIVTFTPQYSVEDAPVDDGWVNMFDAGACAVSIQAPPRSGYDDWYGVLAKGETSSPPIAWSYHGYDVNITASVSAMGVVTLNGDFPVEAVEFGIKYGGWELDVYPQYDVSAVETRMREIKVWGAVIDQAQAKSGNSGESGGGGG